MKSIFKILIIATAMTTVACAKNATNTQSNPLRNYENLSNDVPLSQRGKDKVIPAAQDDGDPTACPKPYALSFTSEDGQDLARDLQFTVGQKKTVLINLSSTQFSNLKISAFGKPKGVSIANAKSGYVLTFQPTTDQVNLSKTMAIAVNVPQTGCYKGNVPEQFKISVNSGKLRPDISNVSLDQETPIKSTDVVSFTVDVTDPNLANNERPKSPQFTPTTKFPTNELLAIDTRSGFSCDSGTTLTKNTSRFTCKLDLNQTKEPANDHKDKSIATAGFSILAQSVSGDQSIPEPITLNLQFPETAAAPAPAPPTPKPSSKTKTASAKSGAKT